ncbi:M48 family metallopeptidase [Mucilaginibacter paludis]|uniref:Peptidase M48 Ste24p n=1 Tax=Mucilaginibacter paludis DSM 18603 TaxID=714943 RepID=H1Y7M6_9SPHI|nr:M48 family metallopeptidase [Mucilaginibacter paludis]EHQ29871.1 peptidase M48 Ste24p [Mucilaginibacter paludis DSM 18603]
MNFKPLLIGVVASTLFAACTTVPLTGRKQFNAVSDSEVNQSAAQSYSQLLSDPKTTVIRGTSDAQRIKNIGIRLSTAIEKYLKDNGYGDQYNFKWEFNLIQSKEVNAWCMPGGKVAVYSGILPVTQTDAGLATVLAHEIGHAIAHHSAERISQQMVAQGVGGILGSASSTSNNSTVSVINQLYGVGGPLVLLSYSRNQESEADRLGLTFMAMAGYDPHEALNFWQRMASRSQGSSTPEFLSDHPSDARRVADIESRIPEAMKYYHR